LGDNSSICAIEILDIFSKACMERLVLVVVSVCLQECIPTLASFISLRALGAIQLAALQALTNLSVTSAYQSQLTPTMRSVVDIATSSTDVKLILQSLRLLANLTLSSEFVDHFLKYKVSCHHVLALFLCK